MATFPFPQDLCNYTLTSADWAERAKTSVTPACPSPPGGCIDIMPCGLFMPPPDLQLCNTYGGMHCHCPTLDETLWRPTFEFGGVLGTPQQRAERAREFRTVGRFYDDYVSGMTVGLATGKYTASEIIWGMAMQYTVTANGQLEGDDPIPECVTAVRIKPTNTDNAAVVAIADFTRSLTRTTSCIAIGDKLITDLHVGDDEILCAHLGTQLLYTATTPATTSSRDYVPPTNGRLRAYHYYPRRSTGRFDFVGLTANRKISLGIVFKEHSYPTVTASNVDFAAAKAEWAKWAGSNREQRASGSAEYTVTADGELLVWNAPGGRNWYQIIFARYEADTMGNIQGAVFELTRFRGGFDRLTRATFPDVPQSE